MLDRERKMRSFEEYELDNKLKVVSPYLALRNT